MKSNLYHQIIEPNTDHFSDSATYYSALLEWRENMAKLSAELKRDKMIEDNADARYEMAANREESDEETMGARE